MRHKPEEEALNGNLTAMIDVVFQLIIFFVATCNLQDSAASTEIKLPMAPNGKVVEQKDPREINVDINKEGTISIVRTPVSEGLLESIIRKAVVQFGQDTPVVIRADGMTEHGAVKQVMDACTKAGLYKVKFAALKEDASNN